MPINSAETTRHQFVFSLVFFSREKTNEYKLPTLVSQSAYCTKLNLRYAVGRNTEAAILNLERANKYLCAVHFHVVIIIIIINLFIFKTGSLYVALSVQELLYRPGWASNSQRSPFAGLEGRCDQDQPLPCLSHQSLR